METLFYKPFSPDVKKNSKAPKGCGHQSIIRNSPFGRNDGEKPEVKSKTKPSKPLDGICGIETRLSRIAKKGS